MRETGDETGIGDSGKSDDNGNKFGGQATASRVMAREMVTRWQGPPRRQRSSRAPRVTLGGQRPGPCCAVPFQEHSSIKTGPFIF